MNGCAEDNLVAAQRIKINNIVLGKLGFNVGNARFQKSLAFAGGIVPGVFLEVTLLTGFLDGLNDSGAFFFQLFQLTLELLIALDGNRSTHSKPQCQKCKKKMPGLFCKFRPLRQRPEEAGRQ